MCCTSSTRAHLAPSLIKGCSVQNSPRAKSIRLPSKQNNLRPTPPGTYFTFFGQPPGGPLAGSGKKSGNGRGPVTFPFVCVGRERPLRRRRGRRRPSSLCMRRISATGASAGRTMLEGSADTGLEGPSTTSRAAMKSAPGFAVTKLTVRTTRSAKNTEEALATGNEGYGEQSGIDRGHARPGRAARASRLAARARARLGKRQCRPKPEVRTPVGAGSHPARGAGAGATRASATGRADRPLVVGQRHGKRVLRRHVVLARDLHPPRTAHFVNSAAGAIYGSVVVFLLDAVAGRLFFLRFFT